MSSLAAIVIATGSPMAAPAAATELQAAASPLKPVPLPTFGPDTSLLIVSPHPDDESLCCAGVIQRVMAAGGHVSIVWITSGDGSRLDQFLLQRSLFNRPGEFRELARQRMQEARAAAAILGVAPERLFFLGYPDQGLLSLVTNHYITPYHSGFTDTDTVPYPEALFPGHPYTGQSLEHDLEAVMKRVQPTLVLAPSPRDTHPDHRGSGILAIRVAAGLARVANLRYWIVHGGKLWPLPRGYDPSLALRPAPRARGLLLTSWPLLPPEIQRKGSAIRAYRTQMQVMSSFLLSFVRTNELYSSAPVPETPDDNDNDP